jgi:hypothetical protein
VTPEHASAGGSERSAALDGWVAAFDREMEQSGDFARSVAAMTEHGCFDVRAVVERWILANPLREATPQPPLLALVALPAEAPAVEEPAAPPEPAVAEERQPPTLEAGSAPDIAYFHNLLQGGIERAQIDEAFPAFRHVVDEAVAQHDAAAPILSDAPKGPSRKDLNDEIRGLLQELQASGKPGRRRWRTRD